MLMCGNLLSSLDAAQFLIVNKKSRIVNLGMEKANSLICVISPDQDNYQTLFGVLDNSFLVAYAIGMFFRCVCAVATDLVMFVCVCVCVIILSCVHSGIFGERLPLRYYLSFGMLMSGLFTCLFGLGFYWNIHSLGYYAFIQVNTQRHKVRHFYI